MDKIKPTLLIIEDDAGVQKQLEWHFSEGEYNVVLANDFDSSVETVRLHEPTVVIQNLGLPPHEDEVVEGFRTMQEILRLASNTKVIVVTGAQGTGHALRAVSMGAYDFHAKPIDTQVLDLIVVRAFQMHDPEKQNKALRFQDGSTSPLDGLVTRHLGMLNICNKLEKLREPTSRAP